MLKTNTLVLDSGYVSKCIGKYATSHFVPSNKTIIYIHYHQSILFYNAYLHVTIITDEERVLYTKYI